MQDNVKEAAPIDWTHGHLLQDAEYRLQSYSDFNYDTYLAGICNCMIIGSVARTERQEVHAAQMSGGAANV